MDGIWEAIKGIGSIVGLLTGGFVVWDRFLSSAPSMIIRAKPLLTGSVEKWPILDVTNKGDRPIIIRWKNGERLNSFGLAKDNSTRSIVESLVPGSSAVSIDTGESLKIEMFLPSNLEAIDDGNQIEVEVFWSFAQPKIFKRFRKRRVTISKSNLHALLGKNSRFKDDG
ncbi:MULTISPECIES: hypothetical protein [unclassified Phyllobacterium]|uniref:hypothetical protein n=1 Tax=unclassified Phyllobacterium TaxID=2638441 RepID=UPI003012B47A